MEYSSRTAQRMDLAPGFCRLLLLLTFSICVPGALGSGHSHLRSRRLLAVAAAAPPNSAQPFSPPTPPSLSSLLPATPGSDPPSPPAPAPSSSAPDTSPMHLPPSIQPPLPFASISPPSPPSPPEPLTQPPPPEPLSQPSPSVALSPGSTWNESEKAGMVIAAIAALLQVAVVAFLLVKRHQMMTTVECEGYDDDYDNSDRDYRHPEHSA